MNRKQTVKIAVDAAMTLALLFLMGFHFWGDAPHEWVGAGMCVLFLLHQGLNGSWYRGLFHGKYPPARLLQLVVNLLTLCAMVGLMVSGVMLSRYVFAFLPIRGGLAFARLLHMASSYWGFVLMALHLGLHWGMLTGMARKAAGTPKPSGIGAAVLVTLGAAVAVYGLTAFLRRDLLTYMFLRTQFVFLDFSESKMLFYLDYLAIMGLFIYLAHYGSYLLRRLTGRKNQKEKEGEYETLDRRASHDHNDTLPGRLRRSGGHESDAAG